MSDNLPRMITRRELRHPCVRRNAAKVCNKARKTVPWLWGDFHGTTRCSEAYKTVHKPESLGRNSHRRSIVQPGKNLLLPGSAQPFIPAAGGQRP
jgi:hypothetical protein